MKKLFLFACLLAVLAGCSKSNEPGSDPTPTPTPTPIPAGEKCKASDYAQVTIGTQIWMAENFKCSIYDTESEAYKEGRYTIPTSEGYVDTPYYTDATDKSKWYSSKRAGYLTDSQVAKLGYLYNWAAAVGVTEGAKQTTQFSSKRQGICPNGWHMPTDKEWRTLWNYVIEDQKLLSDEVGKHLKTTSGWYSGNSSYRPGLDTYGFAILPAGTSEGSSVGSYYFSVGEIASFWSATPDEVFNTYAEFMETNYSWDAFTGGGYPYKKMGKSVRCIKN